MISSFDSKKENKEITVNLGKEPWIIYDLWAMDKGPFLFGYLMVPTNSVEFIERYINRMLKLSLGYLHVYTPLVLPNVRFIQENFRSLGSLSRLQCFHLMDMGDGERMLVIRPMNCPHYMLLYKNDERSLLS